MKVRGHRLGFINLCTFFFFYTKLNLFSWNVYKKLNKILIYNISLWFYFLYKKYSKIPSFLLDLAQFFFSIFLKLFWNCIYYYFLQKSLYNIFWKLSVICVLLENSNWKFVRMKCNIFFTKFNYWIHEFACRICH